MRVLLAALLGALAGLLARWLLGLPEGDPLAGTVVALPLALAALAALAHRRRRALPPALAVGLPLGALGWLVAVAARPLLGLRFTDQVLAAAAFALLGLTAIALVPRLRPLLGGALPARPPVAFFALPLLVYLGLLPWSHSVREPDGDEPWYLLVTHSLAHDFDVDLADNYRREDSRAFMDRALEPQPGDPVGAAGQRYSRHNLLLPLTLALPYRASGRWGAQAAMAVLAALLAWTTLALAARYRLPPAAGLVAWALVALTPPLILYATQIWVEVPAGLLVAAALAEIRRQDGPRARLLVPLALLPLLKLRLAVLAGSLLALALLRRGAGRRRGTVIAAAGAAAGLAALLLVNWALFGNPLKVYHPADLVVLDVTPLGFLAGALGIFFDCAFGLFAAAPLWLLLVPAAVLLVRRPRGLALDLLVVAGPYLVLVAARHEWYGGWSPPFRYGVPLLPLLALAIGSLASQRRRAGARFLVGVLGPATAALALVWLAIPGWTYNFADGGNYALDRVSELLAADVLRFFPSYVRPRLASWLWPAVAVPAALALWWWPRRGRRWARPAALVALLAGAVAGPWLAARLPTRVVELEDAWVAHDGGALFPSLWTVQRVRFRGAWGLPERRVVSVPVVPGGRILRMTLHARLLRDDGRWGMVVVRSGQRVLGEVRVPPSAEWSALPVGPLEWPGDQPLVLAFVGNREQDADRRQVVLLDRVELEWR